MLILWLIALLVVGVIGIIAYRYYLKPPLSTEAKQQQADYRQRFQYGKTLIYQMEAEKFAKFVELLNQGYLNSGSGSFYGSGVMLYLRKALPQVTISIFSATEEDLARHTWQLMQIKTKLGGYANRFTNG